MAIALVAASAEDASLKAGSLDEVQGAKCLPERAANYKLMKVNEALSSKLKRSGGGGGSEELGESIEIEKASGGAPVYTTWKVGCWRHCTDP